MNVFDTVAATLAELSGVEQICAGQSLQGDLGLDSIQLVTLLMELEDSFQIVLDEADMNPFDLLTVAHVVELVDKYVNPRTESED
jgi:acyl carrier protein